MYRAPAVGNKICAKKDQDRRNSIMKTRLKEVRSSLDMAEPTVMKLDHLRTNMKRDQLLEDRYIEIDRSNRILLQKMSEIMRNAAPTSALSQPSKKPPPVSLNKQLRKVELERINQENQMLLKRIQRAQPMYDHVKWEQNHRAHQGWLKNCCEYPVVLPSGDAKPKRNSTAPAASPQVLDRPNVTPRSRSLYNGEHHLDSRRFQVELTTNGSALTITAQDMLTGRSLQKVVSEKLHRSYFRECNGSYAELARRLVIAGDNMDILPLPYN